mmetsp:Transcript_133322/g.265997  ORF Transcript_133322/g.265997 Transcript_133322/m.265997 type:complete len:204 (+) Transcript_133322:1387-1998(+)
MRCMSSSGSCCSPTSPLYSTPATSLTEVELQVGSAIFAKSPRKCGTSRPASCSKVVYSDLAAESIVSFLTSSFGGMSLASNAAMRKLSAENKNWHSELVAHRFSPGLSRPVEPAGLEEVAGAGESDSTPLVSGCNGSGALAWPRDMAKLVSTTSSSPRQKSIASFSSLLGNSCCKASSGLFHCICKNAKPACGPLGYCCGLWM